MYAIHTTPGFIVDSRAYGEADKLLSIFTRDLGLVMVVAQGIRLERSKLRYFTGDYARGLYSVVRGKDVWRLTSAHEDGMGQDAYDKSSPHHIVFRAKIALILKRFLQGEESHPELFAVVDRLFSFLDTCVDISNEELQTLESYTVLSILRELGYVAYEEIGIDANQNFMVREYLKELMSKRTAMNMHINKALRESHL